MPRLFRLRLGISLSVEIPACSGEIPVDVDAFMRTFSLMTTPQPEQHSPDRGQALLRLKKRRDLHSHLLGVCYQRRALGGDPRWSMHGRAWGKSKEDLSR
jgi:hypothetical protein